MFGLMIRIRRVGILRWEATIYGLLKSGLVVDIAFTARTRRGASAKADLLAAYVIAEYEARR